MTDVHRSQEGIHPSIGLQEGLESGLNDYIEAGIITSVEVVEIPNETTEATGLEIKVNFHNTFFDDHKSPVQKIVKETISAMNGTVIEGNTKFQTMLFKAIIFAN